MKGDPGEKGEKGDQGIQGVAGPAWTVTGGLQLISDTLSIDPTWFSDALAQWGALRLSAAPAVQSGSFEISGFATADEVIAIDRLGWSEPRSGGIALNALDFESTTTETTDVVRSYDSFGLVGQGGRIGAPVHPYNLANFTSFGCYFTSTLTGTPSATINATLWEVGPGGCGVGGCIPMATVQLDGSAAVVAAERSTTVFTSGLFKPAQGYVYLVEIQSSVDYPAFSSTGCYVRWSTSAVSP